MQIVFTSPTVIDDHTRRILAIINTGTDPVVLPIVAEKKASLGDCFFNVEDKIKKDGGSSCFGWAILQGGFIIEAEAHAVWKSPEGKLLDITPREPRFRSSTIMFVEDPNMVFKGRLIDNRRLNMSDNPLIDHLIKIQETIVAIQIPFTQVFKGRQTQPAFVNKIVSNLQADCKNLSTFISVGGKLESPCFCNSRKPYSHCHGMVDIGMHDVIEQVKDLARKHLTTN